jgi:diacylglycerol kinase family enzyme
MLNLAEDDPAPIKPRLVALLLNPRAGTHRRDARGYDALAARFSEVGQVAESSCAASLGAHIERWKAQGLDLLCLSGGDGTFHVALRELMSRWGEARMPALLFLHGGTMGDVSASLGTQLSVHAAEWLRAHQREDAGLAARWFRPLRVNGELAFNLGLGCFAQVPATAARLLPSGYFKSRGLGRLGAIGSRESWFGSWSGTVRENGRRREGEWAGLLALSTDCVARRRLPVAKEPEQLTVLFARGSRYELARAAWGLFGGKPLEAYPGIELVRARSLELASEHAHLCMADGEFFSAPSRLEVSLGKRIRVVHPPERQPSRFTLPAALAQEPGVRAA